LVGFGVGLRWRRGGAGLARGDRERDLNNDRHLQIVLMAIQFAANLSLTDIFWIYSGNWGPKKKTFEDKCNIFYRLYASDCQFN